MIALTLLLAASIGQSAPAPQPPKPIVKVDLQWEYQGFPGPIIIYEVKGRPKLWETRSVADEKDAPIGKPIPGAELVMSPGQRKRFALVFRNPTDSVRYFFAAPHTVHPAEHSLGFKFKCLCINHAFKSEPKGLWYRIVEFRLSSDFAGTQLILTHTVIGIDKGQADPFLKGPDQSDL